MKSYQVWLAMNPIWRLITCIELRWFLTAVFMSLWRSDRWRLQCNSVRSERPEHLRSATDTFRRQFRCSNSCIFRMRHHIHGWKGLVQSYSVGCFEVHLCLLCHLRTGSFVVLFYSGIFNSDKHRTRSVPTTDLIHFFADPSKRWLRPGHEETLPEAWIFAKINR